MVLKKRNVSGLKWLIGAFVVSMCCTAVAAQTPAAAPAAPPPPPIPTRTEMLRFDSWIVTCNEFAERSKACAATLQITQQNQVVFSWTITVENKVMTTTLQTPTGILIAPQVELQIGKGAARKIPFASCDQGRCVASATMDAGMVRDTSAATTAEATIQGANGNAVRFNIQMKGVDKAISALSKS